jgi:hypothetical protein
MPALCTFVFSGFTLRPAAAADLDLATRWTEADAEHSKTTRPSFWLEQGDNTESYLLLDQIGPVFFFKMQRHSRQQIELHIQFPPESKYVTGQLLRKRRVMQGLMLGLQWIEKALSSRGVCELLFKSQNDSLISFCVKHMGFDREGERLTKTIASAMTLANVGKES